MSEIPKIVFENDSKELIFENSNPKIVFANEFNKLKFDIVNTPGIFDDTFDNTFN